MSKADIQDAFHLIPIHPSHHHLLGFHWDNTFYYDTALPMGASSSCQLFESCSTSLQWLLHQIFNIKGISDLLDDFFFVGKANTNDCFKALQTLLCLADILGVPIKAEKNTVAFYMYHYIWYCLTVIVLQIKTQYHFERVAIITWFTQFCL